MKPLFSIYTPSTLQPELLEQIFVARHDLADQLELDLLASLTTEAKHHCLLVGPRGIGKTHLVSLLYHRILAKKPAGTRVAWMREDPWGLRSIDHFVDALAQSLDDDGPKPTRDRGESATSFLTRIAASGPLVLFLENADDVFERIGDRGQQTLRAFIQNGNHLAICATSPALSTAFTRQARPFYGTFQIERLDELTLDQAQELLAKVAKARNDEPLATLIASDLGRRRLKVIEHLAGGHPRLWMLFADAIDLDNLDELVPVFLRALDDLTPYYQDRMRSLPKQQEPIVAYLCSHRGAASVRRIAEACDLPERTLSTQLGRLLEAGFVRKVDLRGLEHLRGDGRSVYYELREPLMRLCMEVKQSRGEPIRLVVELLAAWFDRPVLDAQGRPPIVASYAREAFLHRLEKTCGGYELLPFDNDADSFRAALDEFDRGRFAAAAGCFARCVERFVATNDRSNELRARFNQATAVGFGGNARSALKESIALVKSFEDLFGSDSPETLMARSQALYWTAEIGNPQHALALYEQLLTDRERVLGSDHPDVLTTRSNIASVTWETGNPQLAMALFERLLTDLGRVLGSDHPDVLTTRGNIARLTWEAGNPQLALALFERLLTDFERVLGSDHPHVLTTRGNIACVTGEAGDRQQALALFERLLIDFERVLGSDHPHVLTTRGNIAYWTAETGDRQQALALFEHLLTDRERVLGHDHPDVLTTRGYMAYWTWEIGDPQHALALYEQLVTDCERVLGPDHPHTLITRRSLTTIDGFAALKGAGERALSTKSQTPLLELSTELRPLAVTLLRTAEEPDEE
jgi:tetratricopeptide (TPR) repeat protein